MADPDAVLVVFLLTLTFVLWPRRITVVARAGAGRPALFGIASWIITLAIAVVTTVAALLLTPKPKQPKPASVDDLGDPTNSAGREIMKVWGEGVIKSGNILWFGEKSVANYTTYA